MYSLHEEELICVRCPQHVCTAAQVPAMMQEDAADFAESLRQRIGKLRFPLCGSETASFGVAQALPGEKADPLILRADVALYVAKKLGKNRVNRSDSNV